MSVLKIMFRPHIAAHKQTRLHNTVNSSHNITTHNLHRRRHVTWWWSRDIWYTMMTHVIPVTRWWPTWCGTVMERWWITININSLGASFGHASKPCRFLYKSVFRHLFYEAHLPIRSGKSELCRCTPRISEFPADARSSWDLTQHRWEAVHPSAYNPGTLSALFLHYLSQGSHCAGSDGNNDDICSDVGVWDPTIITRRKTSLETTQITQSRANRRRNKGERIRRRLWWKPEWRQPQIKRNKDFRNDDRKIKRRVNIKCEAMKNEVTYSKKEIHVVKEVKNTYTKCSVAYICETSYLLLTKWQHYTHC